MRGTGRPQASVAGPRPVWHGVTCGPCGIHVPAPGPSRVASSLPTPQESHSGQARTASGPARMAGHTGWRHGGGAGCGEEEEDESLSVVMEFELP